MMYSPAPMHIPDGLLSITVSLALWGISILVIGYALKRVGNELGERQIPLVGIMAAFIFAAQMINFPVAGGTSGHLLGGTLAAITLGPWGGILAMASVIIVQGLLFQDGGLFVMGGNILNMGLLTVVVGYGIYRSTAGRSRGVRLAAAGIAAWLSVMTGALATSVELWLSGTARLDIVLPAMLGMHALIGLGEALITAAALAFIQRTRPDVIEGENGKERGGRGWIAAGLLTTLAAVLLAPFASTNPDGLERVAINLGFFHKGAASSIHIFPNYTLPFLQHTPISTILSGALGAFIVAGIAALVIYLLRRSAQAQSEVK